MNTRSNKQETPEMKEIRETLKSIQSEVKDIKTILERLTNVEEELKDVKTTVEFISEQYDTLIENNRNHETKIKNLEKELQSLKNENKEKEEILSRLYNMEQYQRNRNVEIHGIKEQPNEDCLLLIEKIAEEMNIEVTKNDVDIAHRLKKRNSKTSILLAQFKTRQARDLFLKKRNLVILNRNIPGTEIGSKIYINENMTTYNKNLMQLTKVKAREQNYKYIWFRNGKILVKKNDNERTIIVTHKEDLRKIQQPEQEDVSRTRGANIPINS